MQITQRDNEAWLADLNAHGRIQQQALTDLGNALFRILGRIRANWTYVDDSFLEDVVQETLMQILEKLEQFQGKSRFLTWATSIAIHIALSKLRRKQWQDISLEDITLNGDTTAVDNFMIDDEVEINRDQSIIIDRMHSLIDSELSDKQRTVLLAELKGLPQIRIADLLGSNRNAVYKMGHDARKKLKQAMEDSGLGIEDINSAFSA